SGRTLICNANLTVTGDMDIDGTLNLNATTLTVGGSIDFTSGTIGEAASTVLLNASSGTKSVTLDDEAINNLTINASGATYELQDTLAIGGTCTLTNGTFNQGNNLLTTAAYTQESGIFTGGGGAIDITGAFDLAGGTFTQGTSTLNVQGAFTIANGAAFTKATGGELLTFDGTGNITDNRAIIQDLGTVVIGGTSATRTLQTNTKMTSLAINSDNTLYINGKTFEFISSAPVSNNGTFKLQGQEGLTNVTNLDTDSGTVEYTGDNTGTTRTIKDFGAGTDYNNLTINDTNGSPNTYNAASDLTIGGTLTLSGGTITHGANTITSAAYSQSDGIFTGGTAPIDINGNLVVSGGTFTSTTGDLNIAGDMNPAAGTFIHNEGTVIFDDVSKISHLYGTTFNDFICTTAGKELQFEAGETKTIEGTLTLTGETGNLITLKSTSDSTQWDIDPQGTIDVSYVDVKDSNNINGIDIIPLSSIDSGNNLNWFPSAAVAAAAPADGDVEDGTKDEIDDKEIADDLNDDEGMGEGIDEDIIIEDDVAAFEGEILESETDSGFDFAIIDGDKY
ncbi:MAG: hypothetical protein KAS59_02020, partial [Alphaproteobacteria bacterium]|nr:hypothetical protein [Alphaproteobacteria bacterium]